MPASPTPPTDRSTSTGRRVPAGQHRHRRRRDPAASAGTGGAQGRDRQDQAELDSSPCPPTFLCRAARGKDQLPAVGGGERELHHRPARQRATGKATAAWREGERAAAAFRYIRLTGGFQRAGGKGTNTFRLSGRLGTSLLRRAATASPPFRATPPATAAARSALGSESRAARSRTAAAAGARDRCRGGARASAWRRRGPARAARARTPARRRGS